MEHRQFDALVSAIDPGDRRSLIRLAAAALLAVGGFGAYARRASAVCLRDNARCQRSSDCCSGNCRKGGKRKRRRCGATPARAFGCTVEMGSCKNGPVPCPKRTSGQCQVTVSGRPVCALTGDGTCTECRSNNDCLASEGVGAFCIRCDNCPESTSCVCPRTVP